MICTKVKTRNNGEWTEARFTSFIKGVLRSATNRWGPKHTAKNKAKVARGKYMCANCQQVVPPTTKINNKRVHNIFIDHIIPVVGPEGFTTWDDFISRLFCEEDNLQLLCKDCHDVKTLHEKEERKLHGRI